MNVTFLIIDYLDRNHKMWCLADEKAQDVVFWWEF